MTTRVTERLVYQPTNAGWPAARHFTRRVGGTTVRGSSPFGVAAFRVFPSGRLHPGIGSRVAPAAAIVAALRSGAIGARLPLPPPRPLGLMPLQSGVETPVIGVKCHPEACLLPPKAPLRETTRATL